MLNYYSSEAPRRGMQIEILNGDIERNNNNLAKVLNKFEILIHLPIACHKLT